MKNKNLKLLCTLFITVMGLGEATAQLMQTIPNFDKLPGPVVRRIVQDDEGYIWYGTTESGLCRDNGYQVDIFTGDEASGFTRSDRFITDLKTASAHRLLFGTNAGAWLLDKKTYTMERLDTVVTPGRHVESVLEAADGTYWLSTGATVYHLGKDRQVLKSYDVKASGGFPSESSFFQDSRGRLWLMVYGGGLRLLNPQTGQFDDCPWDYAWGPHNMVEDSVRQCFWIGTVCGGVVRYEWSDTSRQGRLTSFFETVGDNNPERGGRGFVVGLCQIDDRLWAAAMDNLYCYAISDDRSLHPVSTAHFMPGRRKILDGLYADPNGNLWVPSFTPYPFVIMPVGSRLSRYAIPQMERQTGYPLIADAVDEADGGFWFLQSRIGLLFYNPQEDRVVSGPSKFEGQSVWGSDVVIRALGGGVYTKHDGTVKHAWIENGQMRVREVMQSDGRVCSLLDTDRGLLVGTDDGVLLLNVATGQRQRLATHLGVVNSLCQTDDGTIYLICEAQGFCRLTEGGKVTPIDHTHHFDQIATDGGRYVWVSSPDGVVACYETTTQELTIDELASDHRGCVIKQLRIDSNGHLWLLTSLYVKEYNPRNHSFRLFNTTDSNIRIDYFQDIKTHGRQVCISGAGALFTTTSSASLEDSVQQAHPVVADVRVDGQPGHLPYGATSIDIKASSAQVILFLTTFDHLHATNVMFAWRFRGQERWNYLPPGSNIVQMASLNSGTYELELMATNEQGNWSRPVKALTLHRLPAWWETWWAYGLYLLLFAAVVFLAVRWYLARQKQKQLELMDRQLADMKVRFYVNISHELRTPLTLIITPLSTIISQMYEGEVKRKLEAILGHAKDLLQQINNLLSFRKLEVGKMTLQLRYGELNEFVQHEVEAFRPIFEKKQVELDYTPCDSLLNFYFDKNIVHHIIFNLLSNAHKFTPTGGKVAVVINKQTDGKIRIDVADTGIGMTEEQQRHIFERFYQVDTEIETGQAGSGIGLNMVSEMVALHHGTISVSSQPGIGSTFSVCLPWRSPTTDTSPNGEGSIYSTRGNTAENVTTPLSNRRGVGGEAVGGEAPFTILLVEDNDEFRQFLAEELSATCHVLQATNGREGLLVAQEEQVDVVVSDVMMPEMDGYELCQRLKQSDKTSHLPVIMLTALAGQESELGGYQSGADYYITKPFDFEILLSRIQQIERQQKERRQQLLQQMENPDVDTLYKADQDKEFVKKMIQLVEKHLADSDYKPEQMASDLCMSYVTSYRKIKALTGLTPGEFMRNYRLKQACQLLRSTTLTLAEVTARTGFSSASYFTRIFTKEYGQSPSQYRQQAQESEE